MSAFDIGLFLVVATPMDADECCSLLQCKVVILDDFPIGRLINALPWFKPVLNEDTCCRLAYQGVIDAGLNFIDTAGETAML